MIVLSRYISILLVVFYFSSSFSFASDKQYNTAIFTTGDVHGHVLENPTEGEIGYAKLKTYINFTIADTKILTDIGDALSGNAFTFKDYGKSAAKLMGIMGYDLMALGNHEFDYSNAIVNGKHAGDNYLIDLINIIKSYNKNFTVTAQNIYHTDTKGINMPLSKWNPSQFINYKVYDLQGFDKSPNKGKLVIIGVTTDESKKARQSSIENFQNFDFDNKNLTIKSISQIADKFAGNDNIVIILSHIGEPEIFAEAMKNNPNIDFVIDGHSHKRSSFTIDTKDNGVERAYVNNGKYLQAFSEITVITGKNKIISAEARQNDFDYIDSLELPSDETISKSINIDDKGEYILTLNEDLSFDKSLEAPAPVGHILAYAIAKGSGADIAVWNSGGIRKGLKKGNVYISDIYDIYPFIDSPGIVEMTGNEIETMVINAMKVGKNAYPQFYGFKMIMAPDGKEPIAIFGIEHNKTYKVAMSSFLAGGGDMYPVAQNFKITCGKNQTNKCSLADTAAKTLNNTDRDFIESLIKQDQLIINRD